MTDTDTATERFVVTDPTTFDGDPFDVAGRACNQAAAVAEVLERTIEGAVKMARNAELSRQLQADPDAAPSPQEWDESAQGKRFQAAGDSAAELSKVLKALGRGASYNPRKPPKA